VKVEAFYCLIRVTRYELTPDKGGLKSISLDIQFSNKMPPGKMRSD